jgi:glutaminase
LFVFEVTSVSKVVVVFQVIEVGNVRKVNSSVGNLAFKAASNSVFVAKVVSFQPFAALFSNKLVKSVLTY